MQDVVRARILTLTKADDIAGVDVIAPLWNNYGTLSRVRLLGGDYPSVILKHIQIPEQSSHPKGFTSSLSKERKIKSYQVETHWYQNQNKHGSEHFPTPQCLDALNDGNELFLLLEDLGTRGFDEEVHSASWQEITVVLHWLAHFHAHYIGASAEGLWPTGTYWHLATRPEELANIEGTRLHRFAGLVDARLRCGGFQTLVHGDAKLANFLFNQERTEVAAVDFQYVGGGCAMKDVAYFVGSCLSGPQSERFEAKLLDIYFTKLRDCLHPQMTSAALEAEWRQLYPLAWADFERFMTGWSPQHRKLTPYSSATTERAIEQVTQELLGAARSAAVAAGRFIEERRGQPLEIGSKGFASAASDVVTEIDIQAQSIILDILKPTMKHYDLGLLAEEGEHDDSRLHKHAFWTIDPLDGTQFFIEGQPGYATSIALVSRDGQPLLGVVYDPVKEDLYEAVVGQGVTFNGEAMRKPQPESTQLGPTVWLADRSLRRHPKFDQLQSEFEIRFVGGAVVNCLQLLVEPNSCYYKMPKKDLGGCAIWDLAAVSLMLEEGGGTARFYDGGSLHLNRSESVFFNDRGLAFSGSGVDREGLLARIEAIIGQGEQFGP